MHHHTSFAVAAGTYDPYISAVYTAQQTPGSSAAEERLSCCSCLVPVLDFTSLL